MNSKMKKILVTFLVGVTAASSLSASVVGIATTGGVAYCEAQKITKDVSKGKEVRIVEAPAKKDIYEIEIDGKQVDIDKRALEVKKVVTRTTKGAYLRKSPTPDAPVLDTLNETSVSVLYRDGNWYQVKTADGQDGYIYETQLQSDELHLVKETEFKLTPPVTVMHWSEATKFFPRGAVATVEDVYTGKKFQIKRTFGTNHADVEALTTADTQKIKEIWGGFSWERRPVIVHYNGRALAASLAGMPHAGDTLDGVKGNGMSGVIDLHFRGSRKHAEGNITATTDPLHQKAIDVAAKYVCK